MPAMNIGRPEPSEYGTYYERYISLIRGEDIIVILSRQLVATLALLRGLSEEQAERRYAPDKWSLKEVAGHVLDFERIFGYRALLVARGSTVRLPGCDQDELMRGADFGAYLIGDLAEEWGQVRRAHISMFKHLRPEGWQRRGVVNEEEVSVRALAYILAGHEALKSHCMQQSQ